MKDEVRRVKKIQQGKKIKKILDEKMEKLLKETVKDILDEGLKSAEEAKLKKSMDEEFEIRVEKACEKAHRNASALVVHYKRPENRLLLMLSDCNLKETISFPFEVYRLPTEVIDYPNVIDRGVPWIGIRQSSHMVGNQNVDAAVAWVQSHIKACDEKHGCIATAANSDPFLPTRVLDLGDRNPVIRLCETGGTQRDRYATLSHCWGRSHHLVTLRSNKEDLMRKIKHDELPKTYSDAILLTRALNIRYLWIDSLCIVQDDKEDWRAEAARMGDVYRYSHVTIAATAGEDGNAGLFDNQGKNAAKVRCKELERRLEGDGGKTRNAVRGMNVEEGEDAGKQVGHGSTASQSKAGVRGKPGGRCSNGKIKGGRLDKDSGKCRQKVEQKDEQGTPKDRIFVRRQARHDAFSRFDPSGPPLLTRAWVYQERVLSTRVLHFDADELLWECSETFACECGAVEARNTKRATVKKGRPESGGPVTEWLDTYQWVDSKRSHDTIREHPRLLRERFRGVVSDYGRLRLTKECDRLPALAGIARDFRGYSRGRYLAGLWEDTLWTDLQWETGTPAPTEDTRVSHAPTWSWAAAAEPFYDWLDPLGAPCIDGQLVVAAEVESLGPDEFGVCERGFVVLRGSLRDVRLQTRARNTREGKLVNRHVSVVGEMGPHARVSLDFTPGWDKDEELQGATALLQEQLRTATVEKAHREQEEKQKREQTRTQKERDNKTEPRDDDITTVVIGESPRLYQCFYLTQRAALLLRRTAPGISVYHRVGIIFDFQTLGPENGSRSMKIVKIV
ncbi:HET-domain-containing protein [Mytilinidion resinicola]|uniref:HET-domain-containing protein n=1 Tax=Mytilinidion resinicola TaxID=574789 RepID=A0A6A6Y3M4_9PEZI|nr:HET-domain-containing protein [Mytilinidion resinicola]KAF2803123.1 HET-domain-containing protein [Mytilinidion resinicola]